MLHSIFKFIFYLGAVFYLCFELVVLISPGTFLRINKVGLDRVIANRKAKEAGMVVPELKWDDMTEDEKGLSVTTNILISYWIWMLLGFITGNWFAFAALLAVTLITMAMPRVIKRTRPYYVLDALVSAVLLIFMLVNAYQLHWGWRDALHLFF